MLEDRSRFIGLDALRFAIVSGLSGVSATASRVDGRAVVASDASAPSRGRRDAVDAAAVPQDVVAARNGSKSKIRPPATRSPPDAVAATPEKTKRHR